MGGAPVLKRRVAAILEKLGFVELRQRGSPKQYRHEDGGLRRFRSTLVGDISPILLRQIARDIGLTIDRISASALAGKGKLNRIRLARKRAAVSFSQQPLLNFQRTLEDL